MKNRESERKNTMSEAIVKIEGLTKKDENRTVVDAINLEIKKGEIFGLLGPNGAGKSTTINMLCSVIKPTAGEIRVFGSNPWKDKKKVLARIGYTPQELAIHDRLKAWENVELFTALYGYKNLLRKVKDFFQQVFI